MHLSGTYFINVHTDEEIVLRDSGSLYHRRAGGRWYYFRHDNEPPVVITGKGRIKQVRTKRQAPCPNRRPWLEKKNPYTIKCQAIE